MIEGEFSKLLEQIPELSIMKQMITEDARPGRSEKWLNVFLKKK